MTDISSRPLPPAALPTDADRLVQALADARAEVQRLTADYEDLKLLYEALMEHGEAVEDQLAESNLALQKTQSRLEAELSDARRYVISSLPEPRVDFPATEWLLVPSTELGGDSFGYHAVDADHFAFYLLDVCGHGVGAALLSVAVINVLRSSALAQADFRDPSQVIAALNDQFPMEKQNNMFFTLWYGVYQHSTQRLSYASAGHPPTLLLRGSGAVAARLSTPGGVAVGAFPGVRYETRTIAIAPGDRLLLLSDGTFEVDGPDGALLGLERLADFAATGSDRPGDILAWVQSYGTGGPLPDDFSLLRVQF